MPRCSSCSRRGADAGASRHSGGRSSCPAHDLEVDGPHHRLPHQRRKDALRDADLWSFGVRVERVPAAVVAEEPERFVTLVAAFLAAPPPASRWVPSGFGGVELRRHSAADGRLVGGYAAAGGGYAAAASRVGTDERSGPSSA